MHQYQVSAEIVVRANSKKEAEEEVISALRAWGNATPKEAEVQLKRVHFTPTLMLREAPR